MRHRVRAIQLKQWKHGRTIISGNDGKGSETWWRNSGKLLNATLTIRWADQLGMPSLV